MEKRQNIETFFFLCNEPLPWRFYPDVNRWASTGRENNVVLLPLYRMGILT